MTDLLRVNVRPTAFELVDEPWLANLRPYVYQHRVLELVTEAFSQKRTLCLFLVTPTGSGKTLASYAYTINHPDTPAFGVYPTNELIRDQERTLKPWIDPGNNYQLLRIDSQQLDYWQTVSDLKQHATTWEKLLKWESTILTNPDILFYTFFGLYRGQSGINERLNALMAKYRVFVFDEFHLYNVKQMADVAFLIGTLHATNSNYGRVFIFASATPDSPALPWLRDKLQIPVEVVEAKASATPAARTIAHPVQLDLLPANLLQWKGEEAIAAYLPDLRQFLSDHPAARLATILDSVAGAISFAQMLRREFPDKTVGEVHGFSSEQARASALRKSFTVGTSTIEVGIDFKDQIEKDVLIFEARTSSQFIQRFGRLARHDKSLPIPNRAVGLVPDYVYQFLLKEIDAECSLTRQELYQAIQNAYREPEGFSRYVNVHAPAEFQAACQQVEHALQPDDLAIIQPQLASVIHSLTGQTDHDAKAIHKRYLASHILAPLLTFRGGGFEAAIIDERSSETGFKAKRYNIAFLLRRGTFDEVDEAEYTQLLERLQNQWPEDVARERRYTKLIENDPDALLGVYGHFRLYDLVDKPRKLWFEVSEDTVRGYRGTVQLIKGIELCTEPDVALGQLNRRLRKKPVVAWFVDRPPSAIKLGRALPPLFEIYELRVRYLGGKTSATPWSIAFNQDAFFIESLGGWHKKRQPDYLVF